MRDRAGDEQQRGSPEDELRVHRPVQRTPELASQLHDHRETEAAEDDRGRDRQADEWVAGEADQVVAVTWEPALLNEETAWNRPYQAASPTL